MSLSEYSLIGKDFFDLGGTRKSTLYIVKFRAEKLAI